MIKGGYKIIDFKEKNHTINVGMVHEGIYDSIENTNKAILISGLVIEDEELNDFFTEIITDGTEFTFDVKSNNGGAYVRIQDNDVVTVYRY